MAYHSLAQLAHWRESTSSSMTLQPAAQHTCQVGSHQVQFLVLANSPAGDTLRPAWLTWTSHSSPIGMQVPLVPRYLTALKYLSSRIQPKISNPRSSRRTISSSTQGLPSLLPMGSLFSSSVELQLHFQHPTIPVGTHTRIIPPKEIEISSSSRCMPHLLYAEGMHGDHLIGLPCTVL